VSEDTEAMVQAAWNEYTSFEFDGTYDSYMRLWSRLAEIGNTHQQAGEIIFRGGSPAVILLETGTGADLARPGDTVVITGQHTLQVNRAAQS
jgi:hypothetical protein